jgi:hypothetical protein
VDSGIRFTHCSGPSSLQRANVSQPVDDHAAKCGYLSHAALLCIWGALHSRYSDPPSDCCCAVRATSSVSDWLRRGHLILTSKNEGNVENCIGPPAWLDRSDDRQTARRMTFRPFTAAQPVSLVAHLNTICYCRYSFWNACHAYHEKVKLLWHRSIAGRSAHSTRISV